MPDLGPEPTPTRKGRVHTSVIHDSAERHVSGGAIYIDDIAEPQGLLHLYLAQSTRAHALLLSMDLSPVRAAPGVVAVLSAADIPGKNDVSPVFGDDPLFAVDEVVYMGQSLFAVAAETLAQARAAAALAVIAYEDLPTVLTIAEARAADLKIEASQVMKRGDAHAALAKAGRRLQGHFAIGGQDHFYLEGQIAVATPGEGDELHVISSTQHPSEVQHLIAKVMGLPHSAVTVEVRRMGGGFGGKESQSALFACVAALAARRTNRPVKLRLDRDDDFLITGRRHCFSYDYEVGFDAAGRILGLALTMISRAGHSADLSGPVMTRALCHVDNAYWLPDVDLHGFSAKTNTQSNTAFRGFGGPQGAIVTEVILDSIARRLGLDALDVRRANYYGVDERDTTPYGQPVKDNVIVALTDALVATSDYRARRAATAEFNTRSPWIKRGLAFTPVKFGISFNVRHLNQAGALVHVYVDGSILVNHGGTEMGQGINTKVAQVVAHELGVAYTRVRVTATDTQKVANTSATAASTGSDLNGKAAQDAARTIRKRLADFAARTFGGVAADVVFDDDTVRVHDQVLAFPELVRRAYEDRVQLWSDGFYATPGLRWNPAATKGQPFYYFSYGAAVSEVAVDTLTGEWRLLRADVLHDVGRSLNPAIDIGQIEGAFIQGMGWLTTEELVWHPKTGLLTTHAPSTYKIPTANDCPPVFNVALFDNANVEDSIHRSKAVGEPPLLLPFSVFLAIRDAVSAAGDHAVDPPLRAPATPEAILAAIDAVRAGA